MRKTRFATSRPAGRRAARIARRAAADAAPDPSLAAVAEIGASLGECPRFRTPHTPGGPPLCADPTCERCAFDTEMFTLRWFAPRGTVYATTRGDGWRLYSLHNGALHGWAHLIPQRLLDRIGVQRTTSGLIQPPRHSTIWLVAELAAMIHGDRGAFNNGNRTPDVRHL